MFAPRGGDGGDYPLTPTRVYTNSLISNLHLLCSKHHNLKTAGSWDVALHPDGHEVWTSHGDGHSVITEAEGPLGRETFAQRNVRKTKALAEYHQAIKEQEGGPSY